MSLYPKIKLSRLREIGWSMWDPIGLANADGTWNEACADEYDTYLLHVVSLICRGTSRSDAAAYFAQIATEHMGLSCVSDDTAIATVEEIANYLLSLPDGPTTAR